MKKTGLLVLLFIQSYLSYGVTYNYHPDSHLYMGGGYNPFKPDDAFLQCIVHDGELSVDTEGALTSVVRIQQVKSRQDFYQKIDFSASIAGSYAFMKGSGSVQMEDERAFHSDSFSWLILFRSNYGRYVLSNPRLRPEYNTLTDSRLYDTCGSEIVIERTKSALVYALFTIHNVSQSERSKLEAHLKASGGGAVWSASMDSSYRKIMQEASASNSVHLSVYAVGGAGIVNLADIISSNDTDPYKRYLEVPKVLSEYIKTLTPANSVPVSFSTKHISLFKDNLEVKFANFNSMHVSNIYNRYLDAVSITNRIENILRGNESVLYELTEEQKTQLEEWNQEYIEASNLYIEAAKGCFIDGEVCLIPKTKRSTITWPQILNIKALSQCSYYQKKALALGAISHSQYNDFVSMEIAPIPSYASWRFYARVDCKDLEE